MLLILNTYCFFWRFYDDLHNSILYYHSTNIICYNIYSKIIMARSQFTISPSSYVGRPLAHGGRN